MAVTIDDLYQLVKEIKADIITQLSQRKVTPDQIATIGGLSDIDEKLGLIQAGEFRVGNGVEPGRGFYGVRMGFPAFSYINELWNLVGVANDVLQFGLNSTNGKAYFGGGANILDQYGIHVYDSNGKPSLIALSADETVNGEALGAGDVLIGDNSTGKPNILWDNSASELKFRVATTVYNKMSTGSLKTSVGYVTRGSNQSISHNTFTAVQFDTEAIDDDGYIALGTDNTKITIPTGFTGYYTINIAVVWDTNGTGDRAMIVYKNGAADITGLTGKPATSNATLQSASNVASLTAGDYLQLYVHQNSGGSINLTNAYMSIKKER